MLFFKKIHNRLFSAVLTALFVFTWLACSVHVPLASDTFHADNLVSTHESSSPHKKEATSTCFDHTPTQVINRDKNETLDMVALVPDVTVNIIETVENQIILSSILYPRDDDPFNTRYSFLIHSKLII